MALLYHWRKENYESWLKKESDLYLDEPEKVFCLDSKTKCFGELLPDEFVFVFTRNGEGRYVLVCAHIHVELVDCDEVAGFTSVGYGIFLDSILADDIEPLIRSTGLSLKNPSLGRNFQGLAQVKRIPDEFVDDFKEFFFIQPELAS